MISDEYFHLQPIENYEDFTNSCFFIGTRIKNRYDEKRIKIDSSYQPQRCKVKENGELFYGAAIKPPEKYSSLLSKIEERKPFDFIGYSNLLNEYNLTCNQEFFKLNNFFYPIDYEHIKKIKPDFNYSTYLCLDTSSADFQSFAQPELFIISID